MARKNDSDATKNMFRDPSGQQDFVEQSYEEEIEAKRNQPVDCLGMTFPNGAARREHFLGILREKLKDPEFRTIEGFPIGEDEDILALSDPPYYTACPNPFLAEVIQHWQKERELLQPATPNSQPATQYHREPFAADVSEGKNDPIYNAHSYHTKVPHKAIMRYILHYTEPGDIVFDGFCGTGMTGVAAQLCGDREVIESLGYRVDKDGTVSQQEVDEKGKTVWKPFSKLGARRAVLNDLSPAATFIAANYNHREHPRVFADEANRILSEVEHECGWMYETQHTTGSHGIINYTLWSDVFVCPECSEEIIFWDSAVKNNCVRDEFPCPECNSVIGKKRMEHVWEVVFDPDLGTTIKRAKQIPVLVNYYVPGLPGRFEKRPDDFDLSLIQKIAKVQIPYFYPIERMAEGHETRRNDPNGITHVHHFYTRRNLYVMACINNKTSTSKIPTIRFGFLNTAWHATQMRQFNPRGGHRPRTGTLYMPSIHSEGNMLPVHEKKTRQIAAAYAVAINRQFRTFIQTRSTTGGQGTANSLDYVFIDPPFGANLNYSELNYIWERWLRVMTNSVEEAIENRSQGKGVEEYRAELFDAKR